MELKRYCITYLSESGLRYRFRCSAKSRREARKIFELSLGISEKWITDIEMEDY